MTAIAVPRPDAERARGGGRRGLPRAAGHDRGEPRGGRRADRLRRRLVTGATWIITIYAVTFAACLAPAGRVADVVGRRRSFSRASAPSRCCRLLCALAPSLEALLVARALQGAAAAAMIPASLAVVLSDTAAGAARGGDRRLERRGRARRGRRPGARRRARGHGRLAVAVPDQRPGRARDRRTARASSRGGAPGGRLPGRRRHRRCSALGIGAAALGISQGSDWGWGDPRTLGLLGGAVLATAARCGAPSRSPRRRSRPRCGARRASPPPTSPRCSTAPRCSRGCWSASCS